MTLNHIVNVTIMKSGQALSMHVLGITCAIDYDVNFTKWLLYKRDAINPTKGGTMGDGRGCKWVHLHPFPGI